MHDCAGGARRQLSRARHDSQALPLATLGEVLIATPIPCAHCITQSSVATVLAAVVGDTVPFTLSSPSAPGVTRSFSRLSDYAAEVVNARVYDGVHYRTSGNVGAAMGRQIGAYIAGNLLTPLR